MLHAEGLATTQELEQAQAEAKAAEAAYHASRADVSGRRVQLQFHAVPFAREYGGLLDNRSFGGAQVSRTFYARGQTGQQLLLGAYQQMMHQVQLGTVKLHTQSEMLEVHVTVPPKRARAIGPNTRLELLGSQGEILLTAPVHFVAPGADPRTQLVDVIAMFQNNIGIRPSELVRTRIVYGQRQALQVPALAVVRQSGQAFVFALENSERGDVVRRRPVTLGSLGEWAYPVEKGLKAGDQIAVSSLQALRDGALVVPKRGPEAAAVSPLEQSQP